MVEFDVVIATDDEHEVAAAGDFVLNDEGPLMTAMSTRGLRVCRVSWMSQSFDWATTRCVLIRSTWDYQQHADAFSAWLDRVSSQTILLNPPATLRWNMDKRYLFELKDRGVHIPDTVQTHRIYIYAMVLNS
jgi:hypothetical protein